MKLESRNEKIDIAIHRDKTMVFYREAHREGRLVIGTYASSGAGVQLIFRGSVYGDSYARLCEEQDAEDGDDTPVLEESPTVQVDGALALQITYKSDMVDRGGFIQDPTFLDVDVQDDAIMMKYKDGRYAFFEAGTDDNGEPCIVFRSQPPTRSMMVRFKLISKELYAKLEKEDAAKLEAKLEASRFAEYQRLRKIYEID